MRLAVVADIHGNLPALEAVIADQAGRRVDGVIDLGDCVSGPLWPRETAALLRSNGWPTVRGNHDRVVGTAADAAGLGPSDGYAHAALAAADRDWLAGLPERLDQVSAAEPGRSLRWAAFHACPADDGAYLIDDLVGARLVRASPATIRARLGPVEADLVLTAHSHRQRSLRLPDGPAIVNPGSVGCPAYDDAATDPPHISEEGSPAARYAIVETVAEGLLIELLSIPYDRAAAAHRARSNGRPEWAEALLTGWMAAGAAA